MPEAWGIMSPPSGRRTRTMTVIRPAPKLKPVDTGAAWRRIAAWEHHRLTTQVFEAKSDAGYRKREVERLERELADRTLAGEGRANPNAVRIGRILAALGQRRWDTDDVDDDAVVQALIDLGDTRRAARHARQEVEYLAAEVRRLIDPAAFERIARDLERLAQSNGEQAA